MTKRIYFLGTSMSALYTYQLGTPGRAPKTMKNESAGTHALRRFSSLPTGTEQQHEFSIPAAPAPHRSTVTEHSGTSQKAEVSRMFDG